MFMSPEHLALRLVDSRHNPSCLLFLQFLSQTAVLPCDLVSPFPFQAPASPSNASLVAQKVKNLPVMWET